MDVNMAGLQLDKSAAAEFQAAVESGLAYLRDWSVELTQQHGTLPEDVRNAYSTMRRLKERLQRAVPRYGDHVEVDLDGDQRALMLSCALFLLSRLDMMRPSTARNLDAEDFAARRRMLMQAITDVADRPVAMIPARPDERGMLHTMSVMEAIRSVKAKLRAAEQPEAERPDSLTPRAATGAGFGIPDPARPPSGFFRGLIPGARVGPPGVGPRRRADAAPDVEVERAEGQRPDSPASAGERPAAADRPPPLLIEPDRIRDARLRSMLAMDLTALQRSLAAGDSRLAVVHLASILEAVVIDLAIPRARELGLVGTPDCWRPERILAMLRPIAPRERTFMLHLMSARNLLRPGMQLQNPTVVTAAIAKCLLTFVRSVLEDLGVLDPSGVEFGMPPIPAPRTTE